MPFFFDCRKSEFPGNRRRCRQIYTCRTPHFTVTPHHTAQMTCVHWRKGFLCAKISLYPRVMVHPLLHATLSTSSSTSPVLLSSSSPNPDLLSTYPIIHCEDPRQDGTSTEFHSYTHFGLHITKFIAAFYKTNLLIAFGTGLFRPRFV